MPRLFFVSLLVVLAALAIVGCGGDERVAEAYDVRGRVVGFAYGGEAVVVDHEDVPGYMEAMRMALRPEDRSMIADLAPGDLIAFRLVVPEERSPYIDRIETLPSDAELELTLPEGTTSVDTTGGA